MCEIRTYSLPANASSMKNDAKLWRGFLILCKRKNLPSLKLAKCHPLYTCESYGRFFFLDIILYAKGEMTHGGKNLIFYQGNAFSSQ